MDGELLMVNKEGRDWLKSAVTSPHAIYQSGVMTQDEHRPKHADSIAVEVVCAFLLGL